MTTKIVLSLSQQEQEALAKLAAHELRLPKDHLRWLIRKEARRQRLWSKTHGSDQPVQEKTHGQ